MLVEDMRATLNLYKAGDLDFIGDKLHRIDPNVVKADFKRAGFVLIGSSDLRRKRADPHSAPRGQANTDRAPPC